MPPCRAESYVHFSMEGMRRSTREKRDVDYSEQAKRVSNWGVKVNDAGPSSKSPREEEKRPNGPDDEECAKILQNKEDAQLIWGEQAPDRPDIHQATSRKIKAFYSSVTLLDEADQDDGGSSGAAAPSNSGSGSSSHADGGGDPMAAGDGAGVAGSNGGRSIKRTYRVGDTVLMGWPRKNSPLPPLSPLRIYALFEDEQGLPWAVGQWCYFWEDILDAPSEPGKPDACLRQRTREVFLQAEWSADGSTNLVLGEKGYLDANLNCVLDILRPCTVRHVQEIEDVEAYEQQPDSFWYFYEYYPNQLRFTYVIPNNPLPGRPATWRPGVETAHSMGSIDHSMHSSLDRPGPEGGPRRREPTFVDLFAGLGTCSHAAREAGFKVLFGVEIDPDAASAYCANLSGVCDPMLSVEEFLERVKSGDPRVPAPGSVDLLHMSPPCQVLSMRNKQRSIPRYKKHLLPLLLQCVEAVKLLRPRFITLEEVMQYLITKLPIKERESKGKGARTEVEEADEDSSDGGEEAAGSDEDDGVVIIPYNDEEVPEIEEGDLDEMFVDEKGFVTVRAWLWVVPPLLDMGYQVDLTIVNAAHMGAPQARKRMIQTAARAGETLPLPPRPKYHAPRSKTPMMGQDASLPNLLGSGGWRSISMCSEGLGLPLAPSVWEAIGDLPPLLPRTAPGGGQGGDGARPKAIGRGCGPYFPDGQQPRRLSRYAEYMRQGMGEFKGLGPALSYHNLKASEIGSVPLDFDKPFHTICGQYHRGNKKGTTKNQHPFERRWVSVAERKRAQGIPDRIQLWGTLQEQGRQVGNAVPWLLAKALADTIYEAATGDPPRNPVPPLSGYMDGLPNPSTPEEAIAAGVPCTPRAAPAIAVAAAGAPAAAAACVAAEVAAAGVAAHAAMAVEDERGEGRREEYGEDLEADASAQPPGHAQHASARLAESGPAAAGAAGAAAAAAAAACSPVAGQGAPGMAGTSPSALPNQAGAPGNSGSPVAAGGGMAGLASAVGNAGDIATRTAAIVAAVEAAAAQAAAAVHAATEPASGQPGAGVAASPVRPAQPGRRPRGTPHQEAAPTSAPSPGALAADAATQPQPDSPPAAALLMRPTCPPSERAGAGGPGASPVPYQGLSHPGKSSKLVSLQSLQRTPNSHWGGSFASAQRVQRKQRPKGDIPGWPRPTDTAAARALRGAAPDSCGWQPMAAAAATPAATVGGGAVPGAGLSREGGGGGGGPGGAVGSHEVQGDPPAAATPAATPAGGAGLPSPPAAGGPASHPSSTEGKGPKVTASLVKRLLREQRASRAAAAARSAGAAGTAGGPGVKQERGGGAGGVISGEQGTGKARTGLIESKREATGEGATAALAAAGDAAPPAEPPPQRVVGEKGGTGGMDVDDVIDLTGDSDEEQRLSPKKKPRRGEGPGLQALQAQELWQAQQQQRQQVQQEQQHQQAQQEVEDNGAAVPVTTGGNGGQEEGGGDGEMSMAGAGEEQQGGGPLNGAGQAASLGAGLALEVQGGPQGGVKGGGGVGGGRNGIAVGPRDGGGGPAGVGEGEGEGGSVSRGAAGEGASASRGGAAWDVRGAEDPSGGSTSEFVIDFT